MSLVLVSWTKLKIECVYYSDAIGHQDIDECQMNNGGCEQVCTNTPGTRECSCNQGYSLDVNNVGCTGKKMWSYFITILV